MTFGPVLVGLLGGALTLCLGLPAYRTLFTNVGATYARFPSLEPSPLVPLFSISAGFDVPLYLLGMLGLVFMGLATAWLTRSRDFWGDLSAGLMTSLASTLTACAASMGLATVLALVVVPSIADMTLFGEATKTPELANMQPSDVLAQRYPDLAAIPANQRGDQFFAKVIADQVVGSAFGVWLGLALSLAVCGSFALSGTLIGGWLLRRGGAAWTILLSYGEMVLFTSGAVCCLAMLALGGQGISVSTTLGLSSIAVLIVLAVVRRWRWPIHVSLALMGGLMVERAHWVGPAFSIQTAMNYLAFGILASVLGRPWFRRPAKLAAA